MLAARVDPVKAPKAAIEDVLSEARTRQVPDGLEMLVSVPWRRLPLTFATVFPLVSLALPLKA